MNTSVKSKTKFLESDIRWEELAPMGINKDALELNGDLERLLNGEKVGFLSIKINLLGEDLLMDASIQIVEEDNTIMLEICSILPEQQN